MVPGQENGDKKTGGSATGSDGRGKDSFMLPDGREILNYRNPATIVTVGLVSFVLLIGSTTLIGYRAGRSEVEEICKSTVPSVKYDDDSPTIRTKFRQLDEKNRDWEYKFNGLMEKYNEVHAKAEFCVNWINDPGKKKGKSK